ncbi:hypothetical protein Dda3937_04465 [Dickeya dadantii 3937]|uniref:Uncharacterized protein n=1 Tax=Dickeya dadantii (strain 3937) TaxID=198628 RepID=E0SLP2_DICD3|nr:hypothetical protein Dda3937_04465 [Dickeya dadantii 3937]
MQGEEKARFWLIKVNPLSDGSLADESSVKPAGTHRLLTAAIRSVVLSLAGRCPRRRSQNQRVRGAEGSRRFT